ncbi:DMT family transporter [Luteimonas marina]|nr:DMT family transporter [Luteimonas marina]
MVSGATPLRWPTSVYGRAALLMLGSTLSFAMMALAIRFATATIPTTEIAFFRNLFGLAALLPLILRRGAALPRTRHLGRYFVRTTIGLASMLCGFWAVGHLPLAQAVSLSYATPLFVTIGAVLWLGEKVRIRRWMAVAAGFAGVLVILRPGTGFTPGMIVALMGALFAGIVAIQIKQLSRFDAPDTVVFYTYAFWVPMSLLPALFQWTWPGPTAWLWLVATGVMGTFGQLLWTRAIALGEVSALQPISFVQLPVLVALGWWLFGETIDAWTMLGAAIVLGANGYIAHREATLQRRAATQAPLEAAKPGE